MLKYIVVGVLLGTALFGFGGPPTQTDDTGTPGKGNWDINFLIMGQEGVHDHTLEAPIIDVNYGFSENTEFKMELVNADKYEYTHHERELFLETGLKWRFYAEETLSMSIFPQISYTKIDTHHEQIITFPFQLLYRFAQQWGVTLEGSYQIIDGNVLHSTEDRIELGAVLTYLIRHRHEILLETREVSNVTYKNHFRTLLLGYKYPMTPNLGLVISVGDVIENTKHEAGMLYFAGLNIQF